MYQYVSDSIYLFLYLYVKRTIQIGLNISFKNRYAGDLYDAGTKRKLFFAIWCQFRCKILGLTRSLKDVLELPLILWHYLVPHCFWWIPMNTSNCLLFKKSANAIWPVYLIIKRHPFTCCFLYWKGYSAAYISLCVDK